MIAEASTSGKGLRLTQIVIASEAKQSMPPRVEAWIASSLRSSQ
jgi:hypothetical protein